MPVPSLWPRWRNGNGVSERSGTVGRVGGLPAVHAAGPGRPLLSCLRHGHARIGRRSPPAIIGIEPRCWQPGSSRLVVEDETSAEPGGSIAT